MAYLLIGNIEDRTTGGLMQVTLEEFQNAEGVMVIHTRVNGTQVSQENKFHLRFAAAYLEFQDMYAGLEDLDEYIFQTEVMPPLKEAIADVKS